MRIDLDTCRDPDLLAGEVRRLQAVIASEQTLTDAEREAIEDALKANDTDVELFRCNAAKRYAAALRQLLERMS